MRRYAIVLAVLSVTLWAATSNKESMAPSSKPQLQRSEETRLVIRNQQPATFNQDAIVVPHLLSYQGKLLNASGNPVPDTTYSIVFGLYAQASGGTAFWTETQTVRTKAGLFSVLLGSVTPITSVPDAGTLYLGMKVGGDQEMTPRVQIASAAYAYLAKRADTANYAVSAPLARPITPPVATAEIADTAVTMPKLAKAGAATGQVLKWTGTAWQPRNDSVGGGAGDNAWTRIGTDSVLYTVHQLGLARGGAKNVMFGSNGRTQVNFGVQCTTGSAGNDSFCAVSSGKSNSASGSFATVAGGNGNQALSGFAAIGGGRKNLAWYASTVGGGDSNYAGGLWATIAGGGDNTANSTVATVGGGSGNSATNWGSTVAGGSQNQASGMKSVVGGGERNAASDTWAVVAGGLGNLATRAFTFLGGGDSNAAFGHAASLMGGWHNSAGGSHSTVGGGNYNSAGGYAATVGGGSGNSASGSEGTVGGGGSNTAASLFAAVGGGFADSAGGPYSTTGGGLKNVASMAYAFAGGGDSNSARANCAAIVGGYRNVATGETSFVGGGSRNYAAAPFTTVAGGKGDSAVSVCCGALSGYHNYAGNTTADTSAVIAGGYGNQALARYATIAGGCANTANNAVATVSGGKYNTASGKYATVSGGCGNYTGSNYSTVAGGDSNATSASCATVSGGEYNSASGIASAVGGGNVDTAYGSYDFAVGNHSVVPGGYANSAAFNGQTATASSQLRCDALSHNSGGFGIDHPLDPDHKVLNHYFVESPDMSNLYSGSVVLDGSGRGEVRLPDYFDALNRNPRVQLTGVGSPDVVYVAEDISANRFVIGGKPGMKVYWQVTGDRKDQSAEICRTLMPVEQPKTGALAGRSLDDASLVSTIAQLEAMGLGAKYHFRTAEARQRYEEMMRQLREAGQEKNALPVQPRGAETRQPELRSLPQKLQK